MTNRRQTCRTGSNFLQFFGDQAYDDLRVSPVKAVLGNLQEPISNAFSVFVETRNSPYGANLGPKTRTITDSKSVLSLFSTDPPSRSAGLRICPNIIGTGSLLIYHLSYLFSNRNQSRGQIRDLSTP